jgi:hypothetical protein
MKLDRIHSGPCTTGRALIARRVEKSGGSSSLHGKHDRRAPRAMIQSERRNRSGLSRFDTDNASAAPRNGMPAGFVAQVLGQVLEARPESPAPALRVYARGARDVKDGRLIRVL